MVQLCNFLLEMLLLSAFLVPGFGLGQTSALISFLHPKHSNDLLEKGAWGFKSYSADHSCSRRT